MFVSIMKFLYVFRLKGLYTLVLEKKRHFYDFFFGNQHNFFLKTERLFIFTCHKVFYEFFRKKIFITWVTIAIVPKHNFPAVSRGEHDKEGTAYLKYTKQNKNCSLYLHALSERRIFNFKQNLFYLAAKTESSDVQKSNFLEKRSPFL